MSNISRDTKFFIELFSEAQMSTSTQAQRLITSARSKTRAGARGFSVGNDFDFEEAGRRLGLTQEQLANALKLPARSLFHSNAGRGIDRSNNKRIRDLCELLSRMDDYIVASKETEWLMSPLVEFGGFSPRELIINGQIRDLIAEFDRLHEGQPV